MIPSALWVGLLGFGLSVILFWALLERRARTPLLLLDVLVMCLSLTMVLTGVWPWDPRFLQ